MYIVGGKKSPWELDIEESGAGGGEFHISGGYLFNWYQSLLKCHVCLICKLLMMLKTEMVTELFKLFTPFA